MSAKETWSDNLMGEAWDLTNGDRRDSYGDPAEVFAAYGAIWTSILGPKLRPGCTIDAADATLMMAGLKLCREAHKIKRDNVVDCHGYLSLHSRVTGLLQPKPAAYTRVYTCDHCHWSNQVTAETHAPRACPRDKCGGTQSPVWDK